MQELGKHKRPKKQAHKKIITTTISNRSTSETVGVGVRGSGFGVGVSTSKTKTKPKALAQAPFVLPDWIPKAQWDAWVEARTKRRNAPTAWAMKLAVIKLDHMRDEGHSPAQILANSAFNGWAGLFEPKAEK